MKINYMLKGSEPSLIFSIFRGGLRPVFPGYWILSIIFLNLTKKLLYIQRLLSLPDLFIYICRLKNHHARTNVFLQVVRCTGYSSPINVLGKNRCRTYRRGYPTLLHGTLRLSEIYSCDLEGLILGYFSLASLHYTSTWVQLYLTPMNSYCYWFYNLYYSGVTRVQYEILVYSKRIRPPFHSQHNWGWVEAGFSSYFLL